MATPTLTSTPTIIDDGESIAAWGGDTFVLDPDIKVAGSNSVSCAQTANGANDVYVTGAWNLSNSHVRLWINSSIASYMQTLANNGMQIFLYDGTNTAYWTVGGSDTYAGGWQQFVIYTGNTPTSGSVNAASVTQVGFRINTTAKPRNVPANLWCDQWAYGDGYVVTGGTSGDPVTWTSIAAVDKASAYGIVIKSEGVIFLSGKVTLGNGATTTYIEDTGDIVVFTDKPVSTSLYQIIGTGSGCHISMAGGVMSAAGTQNYVLDMSNATLASLSMTGKQVSKASSVLLSANATVTNCVFDSCGQIQPGSATFGSNTISNYTGSQGAILLDSNGTTGWSDLLFISSGAGHAIYITAAATFSFIRFSYDGYGSDGTTDAGVYNNSSGSVTLNISGGDTPTVLNGSGASTTINANVTVTLTGMKDNTEVRVYSHGTTTELAGIENATAGSTDDRSFSFTAQAGIYVDIRVFNIDYDPADIMNYHVPTTDASLPIQQVTDRVYVNPP